MLFRYSLHKKDQLDFFENKVYTFSFQINIIFMHKKGAHRFVKK